ncbi:DUF2971 domain-containing protein [Shewanella baltica]|uniref:DUF2971 domain-containing protein n=1 Tax=Shewanella baltica TaxID=62322 RepID=UPI00217D4D5B|nr:DUF2971 domain-containing protein [Shewanella baltica]MCS6098595.1 DUF2971 domain-containing protein [Shewanella baltica]MCS6151707.1 DUF2971 domain-containing protein [Shewanella baltica]MCS6181781.1 DUF2971 domain-containing protein [Shewanella baltica]
MSIANFYRFRAIENLFGDYCELERQSIFFAPPHLLNDPVEGFKDIYWQGDEILWTNLFNHYLLCLMKWCIEFQIIGEEFDLEQHFDTCVTVDDLHENFQVEFSVVSERFIHSEYLKNLIGGISIHRGKVEDSELQCYLRIIHPFALYCIYERLEEVSAVPDNPFKNIDISPLRQINDGYFADLEKLEAKYGVDKVRTFQNSNTFFFDQSNVALTFLSGMSKFRRNLFTTAFTSLYVKKLEQLMFPDWFTACFMSECTNSSVWGNYGKNHTGVCMIFSTEVDSDGNSHLSLDGAIHGRGRKGAIKGKSSFKFYPIEYEHKYESINFFESIARIPEPSAYKSWFSWDGIVSTLAQNYTDDWRQQYWDNFYKSVTKKTMDWKYENEHRLLICNMLGSYSQADTTLRYEFKTLKGIIFGINTSDEDKTKIIEVIENKVKENDHYDFKFYQAYYCRNNGKIKHYEMSSLQFKSSMLS